MLSSTQKRNPEHLSQGLRNGGVAAIAFGAAFALDHFMGAHESATRPTNPEFYTDSRPGRQHTLGVLPGCQIDGRVLFNRLKPLTEHSTNLIVADYPKRGFDVEAVCEGLAKSLLAAKAEKPSILCQSMGGIVLRHFAEYAEQTGLSDKLGGFDTFVLDSSPFNDYDIRDRYRSLLKMGGSAKDSWTVNHVKPMIMRYRHGWSANTPLTALSGQGEFMRDFHPAGPAPNIAERVVYIHGPTPDPVIATHQAAEKYSRVFTSGFEEIVDKSRAPHSHTAGAGQLTWLLHQAGVAMPLQEITYPRAA